MDNIKANEEMKLFPGLVGTMHIGSDNYIVVVTKVISQKEIEIAETFHLNADDLLNDDGVDVVSRDMLAEIQDGIDDKVIYTLRKDGSWKPKGKNACSVILGHGHKYLDPSF